MIVKGILKAYKGKKGEYEWKIFRVDIPRKQNPTVDLSPYVGEEVSVVIGEEVGVNSCEEARELAVLVDQVLGKIPPKEIEKLVAKEPEKFRKMLQLLKKFMSIE